MQKVDITIMQDLSYNCNVTDSLSKSGKVSISGRYIVMATCHKINVKLVLFKELL